MEGGFLGPVTFPLVEHPLPHDARAGPFEGHFHDAVVLAGFTAVAESQGLAEGPLLERPFVDRNPLVAERVGRTSVRAGDEAVEGHSQAEEHFAHVCRPRAARVLLSSFETGAESLRRTLCGRVLLFAHEVVVAFAAAL